MKKCLRGIPTTTTILMPGVGNVYRVVLKADGGVGFIGVVVAIHDLSIITFITETGSIMRVAMDTVVITEAEGAPVKLVSELLNAYHQYRDILTLQEKVMNMQKDLEERQRRLEVMLNNLPRVNYNAQLSKAEAIKVIRQNIAPALLERLNRYKYRVELDMFAHTVSLKYERPIVTVAQQCSFVTKHFDGSLYISPNAEYLNIVRKITHSYRNEIELFVNNLHFDNGLRITANNAVAYICEYTFNIPCEWQDYSAVSCAKIGQSIR